MSFVHPGFLYALGLIAIPIIVHLIQLRRYKRVMFSNTRFLQLLQREENQSNRLQDLLILLMRILTLCFIVLAFAQPYIPHDPGKIANISTAHISIYVDNSLSMQQQGSEGTLFEEAKLRARQIAEAYESQDRFQLLGMELNGNQSRWMNKENFLLALQEMRPSIGSRSLKEVMKFQNASIAAEGIQQLDAFLISDFQSGMMTNAADESLDSSIRWNFVRLENSQNSNVSIDSAWLKDPVHMPLQNEVMYVKFRNHDNEARSISYELKINEQLKSLATIRLAPLETKVDTLQFKISAENFQLGQIQMKDNGLIFDNSYFFNFQTNQQLRVAVLHDEQRSSSISAKVLRTAGYLDVQVMSMQQINYQWLRNAELIVLEENEAFAASFIDILVERVKEGTSLIYFPAEDKWSSARDLFSAFQLPAFEFQQLAPTAIAQKSLSTDLYDGVFAESRDKNIDLPILKKSLNFAGNRRINGARVWLWSANDEVLLQSVRRGNAYVSIFHFGLSQGYGNFANHALVVPTLLKLSKLGLKSQSIAHVLGGRVRLPRLIESSSQDPNFIIKKGEIIARPEMRIFPESIEMNSADVIKEAGHYALYQDDSLQAYLSFNYNRLESTQLFEADPTKVLSKLAKSKVLNTEAGSLANSVKEASKGQRFWKICVILALLFVGLEIVITAIWKNKIFKRT